ncbi:MAG: FAD-binding oxidoreductase, partial [Tannerella sp.]|nr:FAD-binding oxidoreductase [Tannerella sp.]
MSFEKSLKKIAGAGNVHTDYLNRFAYGTDASFYRLIPSCVVMPDNERQVQEIVRICSAEKIPVTFRAAGTSLSGQSLTESVLLCASGKWENFTIRENGRFIDVQPGLRGGKINRLLMPYKRKLGPDPASVNAAMIGGIVANNASGMNGTLENSYRTIRAARILLVDGSVLDTGNPDSRNGFAETHTGLLQGLTAIRNRIHENRETFNRLKQKYAIKNTTGLNMAPFIDFEDPFDILLHLMVGSEGTLGFLSRITLETLEVYPYRASSLLFFKDIARACHTVQRMANTPAHSVELLDRRALKAIENQKGIPDYIRSFPDAVTSVLVETKAFSKEILDDNIREITKILQKEDLAYEAAFTDNPSEYALYWKVRSGIFPSVGSARPEGSNCIIEDIAFPLNVLPEATADLQALLKRAGYPDAAIYGHAKEGNYHFIIAPDFTKKEELERYRRLMEEVSVLVVDKYNGSLKAEHGTGRNMAPFVRKEWGDSIYGLMKEVKTLFDPDNILNPGSIFNDDPDCHTRNMKVLTPFYGEVDKCIECGFCEHNCTTASFTLSPRQRIAIQREIARLRTGSREKEVPDELIKSAVYPGEQTCAKDGLCSLSCPVNINTGHLTRALREAGVTPAEARISRFIAGHFRGISSVLRNTLRLACAGQRTVGTKGMLAVTSVLRFIAVRKIPRWSPAMPKGIAPPRLQQPPSGKEKIVYLPSCMNRVMGVSIRDTDRRPLWKIMVTLLERAGYGIIFPENFENLCCGMSWDSKGFKAEAAQKAKELEAALLKASENGRHTVLCDQSPCLHHMRETIKSIPHLYETVEFIDRFLLHRLSIKKTKEPVAIHITCSTRRM